MILLSRVENSILRKLFSETDGDFFEKSISLSHFWVPINPKTNIRRKLAVFEVNLGILLIPYILKSSHNSKEKNAIQTLNSFPFTEAQ